MSELLTLTAAQAAERVRTGELEPGELWEAYHRRAAADELNAYTWVADGPGDVDPGGPLGGVPVAVKDLFCTKGVPSQAGSRILEDYRPPYTATSIEKLHVAGERARLIERGGERDHAVARDRPVRRLEPDDPAQRGGLADRASGVRPDRPRRGAGRDRRGASPG